MSWDLIVFSADTPINSDQSGIASFEDGWEAADIGAQPDVRQAISRAFPDTDWSDPRWGVLVGATFSFEFSLGAKEQVNTFSIHSRGDATPAVMQLIAETDWKVLDVSTTKWLNQSADPDEGRQKFQNYLDTVIEKHYEPQRRGLLARLFRK
ncbi:hypothetical protein AAFO92_14660 [Roseovarius sp. CAU 1744]|uniref:hypothetical protein n=1 Tax=Roseovarius sp. CAU 1744 TaxID=3140368 RepID=UPI00325C20C5